MSTLDHDVYNPRIEIASIYHNPLREPLLWEIGFYIPRFEFLDKRFDTWQFFQQGVVVDHSRPVIYLSHYRQAMVGMKKQLEEWIRLMDHYIDKYGDLKP